MTPENFCYWLQGWLEIQNPARITPEQIKEIQNHLDLVFTKVTPIVQKKENPVLLDIKDCQAVVIPLEEKTYCCSAGFGEKKCGCEPISETSSFGNLQPISLELSGLDHRVLLSC